MSPNNFSAPVVSKYGPIFNWAATFSRMGTVNFWHKFHMRNADTAKRKLRRFPTHPDTKLLNVRIIISINEYRTGTVQLKNPSIT